MNKFMKMHKLKKMLSLITATGLLLGLMLTTTVYAVEKPVVTPSGAHITISGNTDKTANVICIVLKPGYSDVNTLTIEQFVQACHYTNDATPENGTYTFSFLMSDDDKSGFYTAITGSDGTFSDKTEFYYASQFDRQNAIQDIVDVSSREDLTVVLLGENEAEQESLNLLYNAMGFFIDGYAALSEAQQDEVNEALYANRRDFTGDDASDKAAVVFNDAVSLSYVNHSTDTETMMKYIGSYNSVFDLDLSEEGLYGSLSEEEQDAVNQAVYERKPFEQVADLDTAFGEELRVPYLNAVPYGDFVTFVENNNAYLLFDMERFADLSEKSQTAIAKAMAEPTFETIKQARDEFDDLLLTYEEEEEEEEEDGGSGNFGGSGGSGGGSGSGTGGNKVTNVYVGDKDKNDDTSQEITPPSEPYNDLETVSWAKDSILSLSEKGIVSGDGDGKFRPNDNIKREEFLKIALEAFRLVDTDATCDLDDVSDDAWYYSYIASGMEKGLVEGIDETHFGIGNAITRQDMATLAYRVAIYAGIDLSGGNSVAFSDEAEIGSYAKDAVAAMSAHGIINGVGDGIFAPNSFATRAQACKIISQLLSLA